jgi:hypothetical protein
MHEHGVGLACMPSQNPDAASEAERNESVCQRVRQCAGSLLQDDLSLPAPAGSPQRLHILLGYRPENITSLGRDAEQFLRAGIPPRPGQLNDKVLSRLLKFAAQKRGFARDK